MSELEPHEADAPAAGGWPPWVQRYVMPFLEETGLWPVLFAMIGHVVVIIAPLVLALSRGGLVAAVPLTFLLLISFALCKTEVEARGRPGPVAAVVVLVWLGSVLVAWICGVTGVL